MPVIKVVNLNYGWTNYDEPATGKGYPVLIMREYNIARFSAIVKKQAAWPMDVVTLEDGTIDVGGLIVYKDAFDVGMTLMRDDIAQKTVSDGVMSLEVGETLSRVMWITGRAMGVGGGDYTEVVELSWIKDDLVVPSSPLSQSGRIGLNEIIRRARMRFGNGGVAFNRGRYGRG